MTKEIRPGKFLETTEEKTPKHLHFCVSGFIDFPQISQGRKKKPNSFMQFVSFWEKNTQEGGKKINKRCGFEETAIWFSDILFRGGWKRCKGLALVKTFDLLPLDKCQMSDLQFCNQINQKFSWWKMCCWWFRNPKPPPGMYKTL